MLEPGRVPNYLPGSKLCGGTHITSSGYLRGETHTSPLPQLRVCFIPSVSTLARWVAVPSRFPTLHISSKEVNIYHANEIVCATGLLSKGASVCTMINSIYL